LKVYTKLFTDSPRMILAESNTKHQPLTRKFLMEHCVYRMHINMSTAFSVRWRTCRKILLQRISLIWTRQDILIVRNAA